MFKVFLVEDEIGIRESIRDTLDWKAAGLEYAGDAPDGEMALKAIRRTRPDIVVTDIRMPFMDGLELAALVREELPATKLIILSGHDDFAYAQKAIRLGVVEYLLKPISPAELMRAVNRVALELRREMSDGGHGGEHEASARKRRRDDFLRDLLAGAIAPSEIFGGITQFGVPLVDNIYVVTAVKAVAGPHDLSRDMAIAGILAREAATRRAVVLEKGRAEFAVIFQGADRVSAESTAAAALEWCVAECESRLGERLSCGIGGATERLHELNRSHREAEIACNYARFVMSSEPCLFSDMEESGRGPGLALAEKLDQAKEFLQCGNPGEIGAYAGDVRKAAAETAGGLTLHYAYIDLLMTAAKAVRGMSGDPETVLPEFARLEAEVFAIHTPEQLEAAAASICERVIAHRRNNLANRHSGMLGKARRFIEENYADANLSLQKVAAHVHVSPTHFSAVFSRETGETFSDFLSRIRMANAMRLMKTTAMSAAEISEKVGYKDPQYFSRAFKRAAGKSIRSFRRES